jgi:hypothetical protein
MNKFQNYCKVLMVLVREFKIGHLLQKVMRWETLRVKVDGEGAGGESCYAYLKGNPKLA